jgi:energy-coupling factor transporter ATP-binding protein EcfA2
MRHPAPVQGALVVVTGPPGAGKSAVARELAGAFERSALVRGDEFFAFVANGWIAPWLPEAHGQNEVVLAAAAGAAGRFARGGFTVVYDGVLVPRFLPAFTSATGLAEIAYAVLLPSEQVCLHRVATRTGHGFTDADAARHMYRQFAGADLDQRHVLRDPAGSPSDVAAAVRERWDRDVLRYG